MGNEDGKGTYKAPGGGSTALRAQLKTLADFLHRYDLVRLQPNYTSTLAAPGLSALHIMGQKPGVCRIFESDRYEPIDAENEC